MSEKNKGIFYGIVAIATLIVAIVGATLAYFSVFAGSANNAVGLKAAVVSISYTEGAAVSLPNELIPSEYQYVKKSYEEPIPADINGENERPRCIDDNNRQICHIYNFSINNTGDAVDLSIDLKVGVNEFKNLRYMLYDVTDNSNITNIYDSMITDSPIKSYPIDENALVVSLAGYDQNNDPIKYSMLGNNTTKTFDLVIYLSEANEGGVNVAQDYEQGASFAGTIEVKFGDGTGDKITGYVAD